MDNQKDENEFNERRTVDARIVRLEQVAENLAGSMTKLTQDVGQLAQLMRENNKTNWGVMATWAGVFLMLVVALGNGYIGQPLADLTHKADIINASVTDHIKDGHPKTVIDKVNGVKELVFSRDTVLRKEVDLREAANQKQIEQLAAAIKIVQKWQYDRDHNRYKNSVQK